MDIKLCASYCVARYCVFINMVYRNRTHRVMAHFCAAVLIPVLTSYDGIYSRCHLTRMKSNFAPPHLVPLSLVSWEALVVENACPRLQCLYLPDVIPVFNLVPGPYECTDEGK